MTPHSPKKAYSDVLPSQSQLQSSCYLITKPNEAEIITRVSIILCGTMLADILSQCPRLDSPKSTYTNSWKKLKNTRHIFFLLSSPNSHWKLRCQCQRPSRETNTSSSASRGSSHSSSRRVTGSVRNTVFGTARNFDATGQAHIDCRKASSEKNSLLS